jgi:hypothetical protein
MKSEELKAAIFVELNERDVKSWHDITKENIDQFLIEPKIIQLINVLGERNMYWLVLDENRDDLKVGYQIVFDEREDRFGLATKTTVEDKDVGYLIGLYGSFLETLDNM